MPRLCSGSSLWSAKQTLLESDQVITTGKCNAHPGASFLEACVVHLADNQRFPLVSVIFRQSRKLMLYWNDHLGVNIADKPGEINVGEEAIVKHEHHECLSVVRSILQPMRRSPWRIPCIPLLQYTLLIHPGLCDQPRLRIQILNSHCYSTSYMQTIRSKGMKCNIVQHQIYISCQTRLTHNQIHDMGMHKLDDILFTAQVLVQESCQPKFLKCQHPEMSTPSHYQNLVLLQSTVGNQQMGDCCFMAWPGGQHRAQGIPPEYVNISPLKPSGCDPQNPTTTHRQRSVDDVLPLRVAGVPVQLAQGSGGEPHQRPAHVLGHREVLGLRDLYVAAGRVHLPQHAHLWAAAQCLPVLRYLIRTLWMLSFQH